MGFWALMDAGAAACAADTEGSAPDLFSWIDIAAPLVISCLNWPGKTGDLPFTSFPDLKNDADSFNAICWGIGTLPGLVTAILYYVTKTAGEAAGDAIQNNMAELIAGAGFLGISFGVMNAAINDLGALNAGIAVLSNLGSAGAPGLTKSAVTASESLSAVLVCAVTLIAGELAAAAYAIS